MRNVDRRVLNLTHAQHGKDGGVQVLLICPDARWSAELAGALGNELPGARLAVAKAYLNRVEATGLATKVDVCLLDFVSDGDAASGLLSWLGAVAPGLPVVVLLHANDPDLIMRCLRGGAAEFLIQPFTSDQLRAVLKKLLLVPTPSAGAASAGGRVFCVMPGKGACGATTIACNLAFALRRLSGGRILLADLDGLTGTVAFLLRLKSSYSFVDAVSHGGALDKDVWKVLATASHGIDVLLSPENPVDCYTEPLDPRELVGSSRQSYDYVVLDCGGAHGEWNEELARLADELLLVVTNELPALHAAQRALAHLNRCGIGRPKPRLVVNRYHPRIGLLEGAIQQALGTEVFATLPSDYEGLQQALMEGQAAPPACDFGQAVGALARALTGREHGQKTSSLLARVRGKLV